MAKTVSSIYNNIESLVPFYPDVVYSQSKGRYETEMDQHAMFLKLKLNVTYEQALRWLRGVADRFDRSACEEAMKKVLPKCGAKIRNRLMAISCRYSLAGETACSRKPSASSSRMKSDVVVMNQVSPTIVDGGGQYATHVTPAKRVEAAGVQDDFPPKESLKGNNVNSGNIAFWEAFKKWCFENGRTWCTADVATRGNPYYDPQGGGECYLFFTIGQRSGKVRGEGPLVTIGIYCKNGEGQRDQIRLFKRDFDASFSACKFLYQDWEYGTKSAKRILFIRKADYRNPTPDLFNRMADDYEGILAVMRARGHSLPVKKWK